MNIRSGRLDPSLKRTGPACEKGWGVRLAEVALNSRALGGRSERCEGYVSN
jgi:hypothetical protein